MIGVVGLGVMLAGCCSGLAGKNGPSEFERLRDVYVEKMIPQITPLMESEGSLEELMSVSYKISAKTAAEVFLIMPMFAGQRWKNTLPICLVFLKVRLTDMRKKPERKIFFIY